MGRQWDDWRCYRCNKWKAVKEKPATYHVTPAGYSLAVCRGCAPKKAHPTADPAGRARHRPDAV